MGQPTQSQTPSFQINDLIAEVQSSPQFYGISALAIALLVAGVWTSRQDNKKQVISRDSLATEKEIRNSAKKALQHMRERKRAKIGLSVGTPAGSVCERINGEWRYEPTFDPDCVYCAGGEGGFYALGAPGSGKSFSFLLPLAMSFLYQGFPMGFYDMKFSTHSQKDPAPAAQLAGFARKIGFDVFVYAPSMDSHCLNLLDFIKSPTDSVNSRQMAIALYQNTDPQALKGGNPFFSKSVQSFLQGLFMLAKMTEHPDLLTVRYLSKLPHLEAVINGKGIPQAIKIVFDTAVASMSVKETWGGVQATCSNLLSNILLPEVLPSICGKSTIPLTLDGRQLVIYGLNGQCRDAVAPILATAIHMMTNHNLLQPRKLPYGVWLDELGSIFLPEVDEWPNQHRSAGLCLAVGAQSHEIMAKRYTSEGASRIAKGLNTHAVFRLNDPRDFESYANAIGNEDIVFDTSGSSTPRKGSGSRSKSEHRQTRKLIEPSQVMKYPEGKCVLFSPGVQDSLIRKMVTRARVPYEVMIEIPEHDINTINESVEAWPKIAAQLKRDRYPEFNNSDFELRENHVSALFPSEGPMPLTPAQCSADLDLFQHIESIAVL